MNNANKRGTVVWRYALIAAELLVVGHTAYSLLVGRLTTHPREDFPLIHIAVPVAWVFLFFGSPFLVPSQRGLAVLGWCIAVAALVLAGLT